MAEAFAGSNFGSSIDDSDECLYHIEFLHNREEYGKYAEMKVKRRREDVLFSGRYARDQPTFKKKCEKYIKETYG
jgi:UDP-galactopyranose mutase